MPDLIADRKVKTSELAKSLVLPSSVVLCNSLTQQLNISVTQKEEIRGKFPDIFV